MAAAYPMGDLRSVFGCGLSPEHCRGFAPKEFLRWGAHGAGAVSILAARIAGIPIMSLIREESRKGEFSYPPPASLLHT